MPRMQMPTEKVRSDCVEVTVANPNPSGQFSVSTASGSWPRAGSQAAASKSPSTNRVSPERHTVPMYSEAPEVSEKEVVMPASMPFTGEASQEGMRERIRPAIVESMYMGNAASVPTLGQGETHENASLDLA